MIRIETIEWLNRNDRDKRIRQQRQESIEWRGCMDLRYTEDNTVEIEDDQYSIE